MANLTNDVQTRKEGQKPLRPIVRDRFGERIEDDLPSIHGAEPPALGHLSRIERLRRMAPIHLDDREIAYVAGYELAEAFPECRDEIVRAIRDAETAT